MFTLENSFLIRVGSAQAMTEASIQASEKQERSPIAHETPIGVVESSAGQRVFMLMPEGYSVSGASENGVVLLSQSDGDEITFTRWSWGALTPLLSYELIFENLVYQTVDSDINRNGDIVIITDRDFYSSGNGSVFTSKLHFWAAGAQNPQTYTPPTIRYTSLDDIDYRPYSTTVRSLFFEQLDLLGRVWSQYTWGSGYTGFYGSTSLSALQAWDPETEQATEYWPYRRTSAGTSFTVDSVSESGIPIGKIRDSMGVIENFYVGTKRVDFRPMKINLNGVVLGKGLNDNFSSDPPTLVWYPDGHTEPLPTNGYPEFLDDQNRLHGHDLPKSDSSRKPVVWDKAVDSEGHPLSPIQYVRSDYEPLEVPEGWATNVRIAPGDTSARFGTATPTSGGSNRDFVSMLLKVDLTIDSNNDGKITDSDNAVEDTEEFLFWVNDDDNGSTDPVNHAVHVPDDVLPESDWNSRDSYINGVYDLIDFAPIRVSMDPSLVQQFQSSGMALKLKTLHGTVFYSTADLTDDGRMGESSYLLDSSKIAAQINKNRAGVFGRSYFAGGERVDVELDWNQFDQDGTLWLLFEGYQTTADNHTSDGDIELILVDSSDEQVAVLDIAKIDIRQTSSFFQTRSVRGSKTTATYDTERLADSGLVRSVSREQYPGVATLKFGEFHNTDSNKVLVFLHGFNVGEDSANVTFQDVFKKLYRLGYRDNFVGFTWHGDQGGSTAASLFDANVENAFESSRGLLTYIDVMNADHEVSIMAHSLGNLVVVDALRRLALIYPNASQIERLIHIEPAVWESVYFPRPADLDEREVQQRASWRHWCADVQSIVRSEIVNSFNVDDVALDAMIINDDLNPIGGNRHRYTSVSSFSSYDDWALSMPFRDPNRLAYNIPRDSDSTNFQNTLPMGQIPMIMFGITDIDAGSYGWDFLSHSDFKDKPLQEIWRWYEIIGYGDLVK